MREFRFRAWDDKTKLMYSPEALEQSEVHNDLDKTIYSYLSFGSLCIYDFKEEEPNELIPMQLTGWIDKNQKEIFEGDILETEDGIFQVIWSDEIAGFIISANNGTTMMGGNFLTDTAVVIGNIYENPEHFA